MVMGVLPVLEAGNDEQKKRLLTGVANGEILLTMAIAEPETDYSRGTCLGPGCAAGPTARFAVSGTKLFVPNAHSADYILVVARTGEAAGDAGDWPLLHPPESQPASALTPLRHHRRGPAVRSGARQSAVCRRLMSWEDSRGVGR